VCSAACSWDQPRCRRSRTTFAASRTWSSRKAGLLYWCSRSWRHRRRSTVGP
jgi:hypothetical protein